MENYIWRLFLRFWFIIILKHTFTESRKSNTKAKITEVVEEKDKELQEEAKTKPLIEIVETQDKQPVIEEIEPEPERNNEVIVSTGIEKDGDLIIDHDKKLITNQLKSNNPVQNVDKKPVDATEESKSNTNKKPMKKITIEEIPRTESAVGLITEMPLDSDNQNKGEVKEEKKEPDDKKEEKDESSNVDTKSEARRRSGKYIKIKSRYIYCIPHKDFNLFHIT